MIKAMKQNFNLLLASLAFFGACTFTACSDDDDDFGGGVPVEKEFPELPGDVSNAVVGDSGKIEFNAYDQWTISADQTWVKFKRSGTADIPSVSVSGPKGQHAVTYVIGDENMDFESKTAHVVFSMDNKKDTMVISRVAKERTFEFFAVTETEEGFVYTKADKLEMEYNDISESYHAKYAVRSNYKWTLDVPEWVDIISSSVSAEPNDTVSNVEDLKIYFIDVNKEKATVEDMAGMLDFKDYGAEKEAPAINSIAVSCKGTATWNRLMTVFPEVIEFNAAGLYVSSNFGMEMELPSFDFTALNATDAAYQFVMIPKVGDFYGADNNGNTDFDASPAGLDWFAIESSPIESYPAFAVNSYSMTAHECAEERSAVLLAIPADIHFENIKSDIVGDDEQSINEKFAKYVVCEIHQGAGEAGGALEFAYASSVEGITIAPMTAEELNGYTANFGVQQGYVITYNSFDMFFMSMMKFGNMEGSCVAVDADETQNLFDGTNGWLKFSADSGFQGFQFDFTNKFNKFVGPREATVLLMDPEVGMAQAVIRVVQNVDNGNNE